MKKVKLIVGRYKIIVVLRDTDTAKAIYESCPFTSNVNTWGKEIYFDTNIQAVKEDDSKQIIIKGEMAFWVEGSAIAIGFGPTPVSVGDEVKSGDTLAIVEAMKMQNELPSPRDGTIKKINGEEGEQVDALQVIVELELIIKE